jgi:hypothetical protein
MHLNRVGEGGETDLHEIGAGQAVLEQATDGISVYRTLIRLAHVEMGVEGDQPDLRERQPERVGSGAGYRIVAPYQNRLVVIGHGRADGIEDRPEAVRRRKAANGDVAEIPNRELDLLAGLDVIGAEALQRAAEHVRREVAAPGGDRSRLHRGADQGDRGRPFGE